MHSVRRRVQIDRALGLGFVAVFGGLLSDLLGWRGTMRGFGPPLSLLEALMRTPGWFGLTFAIVLLLDWLGLLGSNKSEHE